MEIKPILFNTAMVQAILSGRKTVTRRLLKLPNYIKCETDGTYMLFAEGSVYDNQCIEELEGYIKKPYQVGDILWVRETWSKDTNNEYTYRTNYGKTEDDSFPPSMFKWKPSIHMPKEAARIFLKVTGVRLERLQDISYDDAVYEGINECTMYCENQCDVCKVIDTFSDLWDSTIDKKKLDKHGWNANPWVWVIEFERCEKPEDREER